MATLAAPRLEPERKSAPFRFIAKLSDKPIPFVHTAPDPANSIGQKCPSVKGPTEPDLFMVDRATRPRR
jgi:hypothetical protein